MFSDDQTYLISVVTDDRGELLETLVLHYVEDQLSKSFSDIWNYCSSIISSVPLDWKVIIEKFGDPSSQEIEIWKSLFSSAQLTNQLIPQQVFLTSIKFCRSLQFESNSFTFFKMIFIS